MEIYYYDVVLSTSFDTNKLNLRIYWLHNLLGEIFVVGRIIVHLRLERYNRAEWELHFGQEVPSPPLTKHNFNENGFSAQKTDILV